MSDLLATYRAAVGDAATAAKAYDTALDHAEQQKRAHGTRSRKYKAAEAAAEAAWAAYNEKWKASEAAYDRWVAERRASS